MIKIDMGIAFISKRRALEERIHYLRIADQAIYCEVGVVYPQVDYIPRVVKEFVNLCHKGTRA